MSSERLTRNFILLRALRWLPVGLVLPFLVLTPVARGLELGAVGAVFAVHSAVLIVLEVPSGALADTIGRKRVLLVGAALTAASLGTFAVAQSVPAFMASVAALAAGRALISGALEAWYVDSLRALDPVAPLARGLSRGTAAEGVAMALGALTGGALVSISDASNVASAPLRATGSPHSWVPGPRSYISEPWQPWCTSHHTPRRCTMRDTAWRGASARCSRPPVRKRPRQ